MPLAEGVSARISVKPYATGDITPNALDDPATAPGSADAQILRRVSSTLSLAKNTYQSAEIRNDRQIVDFRHGTMRAEGNIAGELSLGTYFDLFEAAHRDTRTVTTPVDQTTLTSIVASVSASTLTFAGGDPVAAGLRAGMMVRLSATGTANDNHNFTIIGFSGTNNRVLTVDPKPVADIAAPVTTFTLTAPGASTIVPSTNFVKRKFGFEIFHEDLNVARLYQECRIGSYRMALPATGMGTTEFTVMGRSQFNPVSGPYFVDPLPETGTAVLAAVNGSLFFGTEKIGVATSADITMNLTPTPAEVIGQNYSAEIFLGRANVTGTITAFLDSQTLIDDFINETEVSFLLTMNAGSAPDSPAMTVFMPRLKFGTAAVNLTGEGGQSVSLSFQALKYVGGAPGVPSTTVMIHDTEAAAAPGLLAAFTPPIIGGGAPQPQPQPRREIA
jgi:hypothetical protein